MRRTVAAVVAALLLPFGAGAADRPFTLSVPGQGALQVEFPEAWVPEGTQARKPSAKVELPAGGRLMFTALLDPANQGALDDSSAKFLLAGTRDMVLQTSTEKELPTRTYQGRLNTVFWFAATDRAPGPDGWRYLSSGVTAIGNRGFVLFFLFHHQPDPPDREAVLRAIGSARFVADPATAPAATVAKGPFNIALRGAPWALQAELPGFEMDPVETSPDQLAVRAMGSNRETGVVASLVLARLDGATPERCRTEHAKQLDRRPVVRTDVKEWERPGMTGLEYLVPSYEGRPLRQRNLVAYLARDGVCAEAHLSRVDWTPERQPLFDEIVKTLRIAPAPPAKPAPAD